MSLAVLIVTVLRTQLSTQTEKYIHWTQFLGYKWNTTSHLFETALDRIGSPPRGSRYPNWIALVSNDSLPPPNGSGVGRSANSQNIVATGSDTRAIVSAVPRQLCRPWPGLFFAVRVSSWRSPSPSNQNRHNNTGPQSASGPSHPAGSQSSPASNADKRRRS